MKRLMYGASMLVLAGSFSFAGVSTKSYAAHLAAPSSRAVTTFRLCASAPINVPALHLLVKGIFNGAVLATEQMRPKFRAIGLNLAEPLTMDDSLPDASSYSTDKEIANAHNCLSQTNTIGYDGTLNSGAAIVSEPILNKGGMVMISPANTNTALTCARPAVRAAQEPATYHHQLKYLTYYRTLTTDAIQGPSDAEYMNKVLHISKYYLVDDKQAYGVGLATNFNIQASKLGMTRVGYGHIDPTDVGASSVAVANAIAAAKPQAVFYGGDSETGLALPRLLRQQGFNGPIMGGDAIENTDWIKASPRGAVSNFASVPGPDVFRAAKSFRTAYARRFHVALQTYEATSYDAAKIMLSATLKAARAGKLKGTIQADRRAILPYVASIKYFGATGETTFDRNGDTTNRVVGIYKAQPGSISWSFAGRAPKAPGALPTSGC